MRNLKLARNLFSELGTQCTSAAVSDAIVPALERKSHHSAKKDALLVLVSAGGKMPASRSFDPTLEPLPRPVLLSKFIISYKIIGFTKQIYHFYKIIGFTK